MSRVLKECLDDSFERSDYIFPFFWQHGEPHEDLKQEMDAMYNCGLRSFCVESRTHRQFGEDKWWEDFGFILAYAKSRGMTVWLLDDKNFPTGFANGGILKRPHLRPRTVTCLIRDIMGGKRYFQLAPQLSETESFIRVIACRVKKDMSVYAPVDITDGLAEGTLRIELPEGHWRIFYFVNSLERACRKEYIDMINPESTHIQIEEVYEPHYRHFAEYFGNTFAGFFSDEPAFGNTAMNPAGPLGCVGEQTIPWREDLPELSGGYLGMSGEEFCLKMPYLFVDGPLEETRRMRFGYMDTVSKLYAKCFTETLGNWCRAHGVMYIGHIIEDNNGDLGLSCNSGHYFRALDSQDMGGIDIVLQQWLPGFLDEDYKALGTYTNYRYMYVADFKYQLAKMASSHSHIDPKKKNRAMCEIFGAFGWGEGVPMMRKLADHMLVSGINRFVPHAFSAKEDDPDCPPHFYNKGKYTEYPFFGKLMSYMMRVSNLLSKGTHCADCLLYYSTGVWTGTGDSDFNDEYAKAIIQAGLDFDYITEDYILTCGVKDGKAVCNRETYPCIFVPQTKVIDGPAVDKLAEMARLGVPVYFFREFPETDCTGCDLSELMNSGLFRLISLSGEDILGCCGSKVVTDRSNRHVRHYMTEYDDGRVCMFSNEDGYVRADFILKNFAPDTVIYDAMDNRVLKTEVTSEGVRIVIEPECAVIAVEHPGVEAVRDYIRETERCSELSTVVVADECRKQYRQTVGDKWTDTDVLDRSVLTTCSYIAYEFELARDTAEVTYMDFDSVGEIASVFINGEKVTDVISEPYTADISGRLCNAVNHIRIEVTCNVGYQKREDLTEFLSLPVSGIDGNIYIRDID